ncbi:MAG: BREX-1 system phosphatase PglZ type A, partial [Anaerolineae bacterium]|nr:BREX-1 system phosphatase PglZ type A [Anaerolineae bacterium]
MTQITQALTRLFDRHRIIVWYDAKRELRHEFDAVDLPGVDKIVLDNNAFGVKYRILREAPERKALLYHAGPAPENLLDNWLLDVELAYGQFRADQVSLWLGEMGLGLEFADTVAPHAEFFQAARRREALKASLVKDDTPRQVWLKMLAVCAGAEPRIDEIVEALLAERAAGDEESMRLIRRATLDAVLWEELKRAYGYSSDTPGIHDFAITLFASCYAMEVRDLAS